jgi:hypothetical protein
MAGTDSLKRVTFSAGAPLDPDDLNTLQGNIDKVNSAANLYNSTIGGLKTIPSIQAGTITARNVSSASTVPVNLPTFTGNPQIFFTPVYNNSMSKSSWISVAVDKSSSPWRAQITTNISKAFNLDIDWLSVEMVPVV